MPKIKIKASDNDVQMLAKIVTLWTTLTHKAKAAFEKERVRTPDQRTAGENYTRMHNALKATYTLLAAMATI